MINETTVPFLETVEVDFFNLYFLTGSGLLDVVDTNINHSDGLLSVKRRYVDRYVLFDVQSLS